MNPNYRNDNRALLLRLRHLYVHEHIRSRLFALLDGQTLPGIDRKFGQRA